MFKYMLAVATRQETGPEVHHLSEECSGTSLLLRKAGLQT